MFRKNIDTLEQLNDLDELKPLPLIRQLSVSYADPKTGFQTNNDPSAYTGEERCQREDALGAENPDSGYWQGIQERRTKEFYAFSQLTCKSDSHKKDKKDDDNTPAASSCIVKEPIQTCKAAFFSKSKRKTIESEYIFSAKAICI